MQKAAPLHRLIATRQASRASRRSNEEKAPVEAGPKKGQDARPKQGPRRSEPQEELRQEQTISERTRHTRIRRAAPQRVDTRPTDDTPIPRVGASEKQKTRTSPHPPTPRVESSQTTRSAKMASTTLRDKLLQTAPFERRHDSPLYESKMSATNNKTRRVQQNRRAATSEGGNHVQNRPV